jgi:hypothetical protein
MADFDPLTVPAVMPKSVRRILDDGTPTQSQLDFEQALQSWFKSNTANFNDIVGEDGTLTNRVIDVETVAGDAAAEAALALSTAIDAGVAASALEAAVKARFGETVTIGGLYIASVATGGGFGEVRISLGGKATVAGTTYAVGMDMIVDTAGNSRIDFNAGQIRYIHPTTSAVLVDFDAGLGPNGKMTIAGDVQISGDITRDSLEIASQEDVNTFFRGNYAYPGVSATLSVADPNVWLDIGSPYSITNSGSQNIEIALFWFGNYWVSSGVSISGNLTVNLDLRIDINGVAGTPFLTKALSQFGVGSTSESGDFNENQIRIVKPGATFTAQPKIRWNATGGAFGPVYGAEIFADPTFFVRRQTY